MDRATANILRTLGIIAVAISMLVASGFLLLLGLCFRSPFMHSPPAPADRNAGLVAYALAVFVLIGGILAISRIARGYIRNPRPQPLDRSRVVLPSAADIAAQFRQLLPPNPQPRGVDVATHLSSASSAAVQPLTVAIVAKIAAEVLLGVVGWYGALGTPRAPFPVYRLGFMAWGLAAIAPHLVLLYALSRRPSRTAFSYALIIPSLHILFGIFGHSAFLAFILRAGQVAAPLLTIVPWLIDILILYLAWKAIRLTGLLPDPASLIVSSAVIFLYTSLLPVLVFALNSVHL